MLNKNDDRTGRSAVCVLVSIVALALLAPSAASAWPDSPFTPELTFNSTTHEAGARPDLIFNMHKKIRTGCVPPGPIPDPPIYVETCNTEPIPLPPSRLSNVFYIDQNLKKMSVRLPPGLTGDVNAASYCDPYQKYVSTVPEPNEFLHERWFCTDQSLLPDSMVGYVDMDNYFCVEGRPWTPNKPYNANCSGRLLGPGAVYNARPRRDSNGRLLEQGHLVVLWPDFRGLLVKFPPGDPWHEYFKELVKWAMETSNMYGFSKADISIKVRDGADGDFGLDSIADDIPDIIIPSKLRIETGEITRTSYPGQISDMEMGLSGRVGAGKGHPFLSNPTFCEPQTIGVEFQGYAHNSTDGYVPIGTQREPGWGDGLIVTPAPVPYQMTPGCDKVPYAPTFTVSADSDAPGATPALSAVVTQADNEATTKKIQVEFPRGMGININSTLKSCSVTDLAAKNCPESSKMGTVEVESRLLPKREFLGSSVRPEDEVLRGNVYLTGQVGDKLTLTTLISGFIDIQLNATAGVIGDRVIATFDDMPAQPSSRITLNLFGGEKSLITNPRKCGPATATATFTSHSGKVHTAKSISQIKGCSPPPEPEFEVDLSDNTKGKRTSVELDLSSRERYIKKVTLGLPRYLKFSTKRLGKKKNFGRLALDTERGELESSLSLSQSVRAKRKKKKAIRFSSKGALNSLKVSLFKRKVKTRKVRVRTKSGKKKTLKRSVLKSRMSFKSLPKQDIKGLTVELNPSESRFLRNPKGCKKPLRFLAFVTTSDGKRHVLSQKVKLKGKGCSKKKKKKSKKKAKKAFTTPSSIWG